MIADDRVSPTRIAHVLPIAATRITERDEQEIARARRCQSGQRRNSGYHVKFRLRSIKATRLAPDRGSSKMEADQSLSAQLG